MKILSLIALLATGIYAVENRYAKATNLAEKADASTVAQLQQEILQDKLEEIEYEIFVFEKIPQKSELQEFRYRQLQNRQERIELLINGSN